VKTPLGHSILFAIIWVYVVSLALYIAHVSGGAPERFWTEGTLAMATGYGSHLLIDAITADGIYSVPKTKNVRKWLRIRDSEWRSWRSLSASSLMKKKRSNDDMLLNIGICVVSFVLLLIIVALG
jgi:membrane-bound metal-dependent hydrolase YbcI (DUF457 family)